MWKRHVLRSPEDGEGGSAGGAAAPAASPAASPAAAPAAGPSPAPSPSAGAPAAPVAPAAPAAPAAAPAAGAPAGAPAAAAPAADAKGYWPADWRETVSKGDEKTLERMKRYASPEAGLAALIAAQNRIAQGELKPVLGKNATPEQISEYRAALGIPDAPDKYDLGKDMPIGDAEKPLMSKLFAAAHGTNQTPEQVKSVVKVWRDIQVEVAEARQAKDEEGRETAADALRVEWGPEFRRNINLINGMLDGAGSQTLKDQLLDARLPDGTKFGNSPEVMKMLVGLALIQNPTGVVVPGGNGDPGTGIREELAKIAKARSTDRKAYDKDTKMQERERELLGAAVKMNLMDERGNWKKAA